MNLRDRHRNHVLNSILLFQYYQLNNYFAKGIAAIAHGYFIYDLHDMLKVDNYKVTLSSFVGYYLHHIIGVIIGIPFGLFNRWEGLTMTLSSLQIEIS